MKKSCISFWIIIGLLTLNLAAETVDEIITKNIEARGGRANLDAIQTLMIKGTMKMMGMQATLTVTTMRPNKVRRELVLPGQRIVEAYDGETAWHIAPFMGSPDPQKLPPAEAEALADNADFDGALVDYQQKGHRVELIGKEELQGTEVYHLKITQHSGRVVNLYLDSQNYLEMKLETTQPFREEEVKLTAYFSDYRPVKGVMMAHSIKQLLPQATQEVTIDEIKVNQQIDESVFSMPASQD